MKTSLLLLIALSAEAFQLPSSLKELSNHPRSSKTNIGPLSSSIIDEKLSVQAMPQPEKEKFDWTKAWYPLVPVEILDSERPHKLQLLGTDVVVWNDGKVEGGIYASKKKRPRKAKRQRGQWRAFVDECPHRKVPLSEGRVEDDGSLLCSYHGWRFDGHGKLVNVPQAGSKEEVDRIKANPKSNCNALPTKIVNGLLWVWPNSSEDARIESKLTPVQNYETPDGVDADRAWIGPWNFRELPYGHDYFIENVVDPAHVEVSHHNTAGSRYDDQKLVLTQSASLTKNGFAANLRRLRNNETSTITYKAPSSVHIEGHYSEGALQVLELYSSPTRPGFSLHSGRMIVIPNKSGKFPKMLKRFTLPVPKWLNHVMAAAFLNQDALFLHHQERHLAKQGAYKSALNDNETPLQYTKAVLPTASDKGVINFRNWLQRYAGGRIPYKNDVNMPEADNEIVFDQWNGHTKYCRYCQKALSNLKKVRFASFFVATCLAVLRPSMNKALNLAGVLSLGGVGLLLNKLIGKFYRYEFSHAHND